MRITSKVSRVGSLPLALAVLVGCATAAPYPPPTTGQVAQVEGALAAARAAGAELDERALRHLRLAEVQLTEAKQYLAVGQNRAATQMLVQAEADADLSKMLERQAEATAEARAAESELRETKATQSRP